MAGEMTPVKVVIVFLLVMSREVICLKMIDVIVPAYKIRGDNALLECQFDLEKDLLYSVKWYKDNEEFYRFMPRQSPAQHSYRVEGIKVDHHLSGDMKVTLKSVTLKSSGSYKCEVSAEAPSFSSASGDGYMEVVYLARDGPYITGKESGQKQGDVLNLNCTSGRSYPSSILNWYINDEKVTNSIKLIDYTPIVHKHGLLTTVSGLRLFLDSEPFFGGILRIRCVAIISPMVWSTDQETLGDRVAPLLDNREAVITLRNGGSSTFLKCEKIIVILIFFRVIVALTIH